MRGELTASEIKLRLMAWLLPRLELDEVLASELPFLEGKRRADLAIVSDERLCAFEIKGPRDNLQKLREQTVDYRRMFLEVYVAASPKHLKAIRSIVASSVGLISVVDSGVDVERAARVRNRLEKESALSWLNTADLRSTLRAYQLGPNRLYDKEEMRRMAAALSAETLSSIATSAVRKRNLDRYEAFVRELGLTPTLDDLRMLTLERRVIP